jgi:hypothetical protein
VAIGVGTFVSDAGKDLFLVADRTSLAGFGSAFLPHPPGGRKPVPAAPEYPAAVSQRIPMTSKSDARTGLRDRHEINGTF